MNLVWTGHRTLGIYLDGAQSLLTSEISAKSRGSTELHQITLAVKLLVLNIDWCDGIYYLFPLSST